MSFRIILRGLRISFITWYKRYMSNALWKEGLTLSQTRNFRLSKTQRLHTTILYWWKWWKILQKGRKYCGKRRNCSLREFSTFPSVFKRLVLQTCKNKGLFWRGLMKLQTVSTLLSLLCPWFLTWVVKFCFWLSFVQKTILPQNRVGYEPNRIF